MFLTPDMRWRVDFTNSFRLNNRIFFSEAFAKWCNLSKTEYLHTDQAFQNDNNIDEIEFSYASIADTYNRIRRLLFSTDMFIQMEVSSGYSMTRVMSDYLMPKSASLNYGVNSGGFASSDGSFSENLPQTITYTAD